MTANYDRIAPIYDTLSRIVFGNAIIDAQVSILRYIPRGSTILIVGGGSGWILERIAEQIPEGLTIDYVESSEQMILLSQKRNCGQNKVNFIHQPIESHDASKLYNVIITPFLFDNFSKEKIDVIFKKLDSVLNVNGLWLYTDYAPVDEKSPIWQRLLLKTMYLFFRIVSSVEAADLTDMNEYFAAGYRIEFEASYYFHFIRSVVYRKEEDTI